MLSKSLSHVKKAPNRSTQGKMRSASLYGVCVTSFEDISGLKHNSTLDLYDMI